MSCRYRCYNTIQLQLVTSYLREAYIINSYVLIVFNYALLNYEL